MKSYDFKFLTNEERKPFIHAVLDFDGVPEAGRLGYLMRTCKLSRYMAQRLLNGYVPRYAFKIFDITDALDVDWEWLIVGSARRYHPRTLRIHLLQINYYSKEATDQMVRLMVGVCAGHKKALNLSNLAVDGKMSMLSAARLF